MNEAIKYMNNIEVSFKNLTVEELKLIVSKLEKKPSLISQESEEVIDISELPIFKNDSKDKEKPKGLSTEEKCEEIFKLIDWNSFNSNYKKQFKKTLVNWINFLEEKEE